MWIPPAWLFPVTVAASLTMRVFGLCLFLGGLLVLVGRSRAHRRTTHLGAALLIVTIATWGLLHVSRPPWQRAALAEASAPPTIEASPFVTVSPGVEVSTYRLTSRGEALESIDLVRLDPANHQFSVFTDSAAPRTIDAWRDRLQAVAVVNGSYFLPDHTPQTPLRSGGQALGPASYTSTHAAFVSDPTRGTAAIVDLAGVTLPRGLTPFPEAMVSYPLLLASDGSSRAGGSHDWLASRTFVGIDGRGWVVFGTTHHGYFTLRRLAEFLHDAPIGLVTALNLDGGPIAAQAVQAGGYHRTTIGDAETNAGEDVLRARWQALRHLAVPLPIVLAALPRSE